MTNDRFYHGASPAQRDAVRRRTKKAVALGELAVAPFCEVCFRNRNVAAHHWTYDHQNSAFDVSWLCKGCHRHVHWGIRVGYRGRTQEEVEDIRARITLARRMGERRRDDPDARRWVYKIAGDAEVGPLFDGHRQVLQQIPASEFDENAPTPADLLRRLEDRDRELQRDFHRRYGYADLDEITTYSWLLAGG